jgi:hypothetical protein
MSLMRVRSVPSIGYLEIQTLIATIRHFGMPIYLMVQWTPLAWLNTKRMGNGYNGLPKLDRWASCRGHNLVDAPIKADKDHASWITEA